MQQKPVDEFFAKEKPEYVFIAAAKVGGLSQTTHFGPILFLIIC